MSNVRNVFVYALLALASIVIDFVDLAGYFEGGHSMVPLVLGLVLSGLLLILTGAALYQSIKHRHDKEPW